MFLFLICIIFIVVCLIAVLQNTTFNVKTSIPEPQPILRCPCCHSTSITADKNGFGFGKAAIGAIAIGPLGLLAGGLGSKKIKLNCLMCGNQWSPTGIEAKLDKDRQKAAMVSYKHLKEIEHITERSFDMDLAPAPITPLINKLNYMKRSQYNKNVQNGVLFHEDDYDYIKNFIKNYNAELSTKNIKVVSDIEYNQLTSLK